MTDADATSRAGRSTPDQVADQATDAVVSAHTSAPGRTVLTQTDNVDAWIASDLTVDCSR
mgnify:CR=1 FL=1